MRVESKESMIEFLEKVASYFEHRPTGGEDRTYWANVYNAENCREIAKFIESLPDDIR